MTREVSVLLYTILDFMSIRQITKYYLKILQENKMAKLNPISFKVQQAGLNIKVKELFNSEEIVIIPMDSQNDGELYVALNPNSTEVKTSTFAPVVTGIISNTYTGFTDVDSADNVLTYTSSDSTGIIAGETVTITQGIASYLTSVISNVDNVITLNLIAGEEVFAPNNLDILTFNHSTWYYITSSIEKVALGDKFSITLDDDSSVQVKEVTYKDATHIGFKVSTENYTSSDTLQFESDVKLDGIGLQLKSNDYPSGLLFKHATTDSSVNNLTIFPRSEYNQAVKFFF